jgi:hypothetical protein
MIRKAITVFLLFTPASLFSQGTQADYERASNLRTQTQGLAYNSPERATGLEHQ